MQMEKEIGQFLSFLTCEKEKIIDGEATSHSFLLIALIKNTQINAKYEALKVSILLKLPSRVEEQITFICGALRMEVFRMIYFLC